VAPSFYVTGNAGPGDPNGTNNLAMTALINASSGETSSPLSTTYLRSSPIPVASGYVPITADPVSVIAAPSGPMLNGVGASRRVDCRGTWVDARDSVDSRIVTSVANGTTLYGFYDYSAIAAAPQSQDDLGGWPALTTDAACSDGNNNGLPDGWESHWGGVFGVNTLNPNGSNFGDGYTVIEHFIHGMSPSP